MHIISRKALREFGAKYPDAVGPLDDWYNIVRRAGSKSPKEVKAQFGNASFLDGSQVVFNAGGNKFRIVVDIFYRGRGTVLVRHVFTHAEYDDWNDERRKKRST